MAQGRFSIPADSNLKRSTPIAPGVAVPDKIESPSGTLNLSYSHPTNRLNMFNDGFQKDGFLGQALV